MSQEGLEEWHGCSVDVWRERWGVPAVEVYARTGSTNDRAKELAARPGSAFSVVIAEEQTDGRGRRGARWHSPAGTGLWMSVVLPDPGAALYVPLLVGLAASEAIQDLSAGTGPAGALRVGIEWPNDLVVGDKKLGGILCEAVPGAVVAGIGINVHTPAGGFPGFIQDRATSLEAEGVNALSHSELVGLIVGALERRTSEPTRLLDPETLREIGARDALAARRVLTEEYGPGTARGIEADGALVLERPDGSRVRVVAGSVRPDTPHGGRSCNSS